MRSACGSDSINICGYFAIKSIMAALLIGSSKVEIIMGRFGDAAEMYEHDGEIAKAIVKIRKSEPFFGWIAGLGDTVRIHVRRSSRMSAWII